MSMKVSAPDGVKVRPVAWTIVIEEGGCNVVLLRRRLSLRVFAPPSRGPLAAGVPCHQRQDDAPVDGGGQEAGAAQERGLPAAPGAAAVVRYGTCVPAHENQPRPAVHLRHGVPPAHGERVGRSRAPARGHDATHGRMGHDAMHEPTCRRHRPPPPRSSRCTTCPSSR
jgi:hypothetical protein